MTNKVFLMHRWDGTPESDWYPWLVKELTTKGFEVCVPKMPNTSTPKIESWVAALRKAVGQPTTNTFFIGHSMGSQTIMRYLETLSEEEQIGGCLFIAGWFNLANLENKEVEQIAKPWMTRPINLMKVRIISPKISVVLSENDPFNCVQENASKFSKELGARVLIEKNQGHFTEDDKIFTLPLALNEFLRLTK